MTIGDFSRATRLSAKALRFYHQAGLLEPASVDPDNGYRLYAPEQISDALVIRRLRALDMPVELVREVLAASQVVERNRLVAGHLARMETELERTREAVASLRGLLEHPEPSVEVQLRTIPPTLALVVRGTIDRGELGDWYTAVTRELTELASSPGIRRAGPRGGLWSTELFLDERGPAALFVPVAEAPDEARSLGGAVVETLPAVDLAVATHRGPDETMAQTYGALGEYVARHEIGVEGPIRETYLEEGAADGSGAVTEVGWPIFRSTR